MSETKKKSRPRTFVTASAAWPDHLGAVTVCPCDDHLQSLCTLLDVMDGEVVRMWGEPGHDDRRLMLSARRAAAAKANARVAAAVTESRSSAAKARMAARKAAKSEVVAHGAPIHGVECYEAWRLADDCPHEAPSEGGAW